VICQCDSLAVVEVVSFGYSKVSKLAQLLRVLFFAKAWGEFELITDHIITGCKIVLADALSRNNMLLFFFQAPR